MVLPIRRNSKACKQLPPLGQSHGSYRRLIMCIETITYFTLQPVSTSLCQTTENVHMCFFFYRRYRSCACPTAMVWCFTRTVQILNSFPSICHLLWLAANLSREDISEMHLLKICFFLALTLLLSKGSPKKRRIGNQPSYIQSHWKQSKKDDTAE